MSIFSRILAIPALAISLFFSSGPLVVLAQDTTAPPPPPAGTRQEARDERREQFQERREEFKERLSEVKQKRIRAFWEKMSKRLANAIERHERIADKIEKRIVKFEEKGVDVSAAKSKLADGRAQLVNATSALAAAKVAVEELLASDDPKGAFPKVRDQVKAVRGEIKEAHQLLVDAISSLRAAKPETDESETAPQD